MSRPATVAGYITHRDAKYLCDNQKEYISSMARLVMCEKRLNSQSEESNCDLISFSLILEIELFPRDHHSIDFFRHFCTLPWGKLMTDLTHFRSEISVHSGWRPTNSILHGTVTIYGNSFMELRPRFAAGSCPSTRPIDLKRAA